MAFYVFEDRDNLAYFAEFKEPPKASELPSNDYVILEHLPVEQGLLKVSVKDQKVWVDPYPVFVKESTPVISESNKIQALSDRQDFLEDCIIEMAQKVYE